VNGERGKSKSRTKKSKATIASIRLFVDPRLAERVYSALELPLLVPLFHPLAARRWWCCEPVGSAAASPVGSSTVPSFAAAMEASATGHAYASPTVRTFGEAMEGVAEAAASSSFAGFAGVWSEGAPRKERRAGKGGKQDSLAMPTFAPAVRTRLAVAVVDFARAFGRARVALAAFSGLPCVSLVCRFRVHVHVRLCQLASPTLIFLPTLHPHTYKPRTAKRIHTPPVFVHHARIGVVLLRALKAQGGDAGVGAGKRWRCEVVRGEFVFEWG
jgi:hypothetical protein